MSDFKPGDLANVVKPMPCCGNGMFGHIFTVGSVPSREQAQCCFCGAIFSSVIVYVQGLDSVVMGVDLIKKIDPPAEGDSLTTSRDIEVLA